MEKQEYLFPEFEDFNWENEWKNMPEFIQNDLMPYRTLYIHFENEEDIKAFSEIVEQNITDKTKYLWFPEATSKKASKYRWVEEDKND